MRFHVLVSAAFLSLTLALLGCPMPPNPDGGTGGGRGGGNGGGGGTLTKFDVSVLDANAKDATYLAIAVDGAQQRVGVVYLTPAGTTTMAGHPDYQIKYLEWKAGSIVVPPENVRGVVQNFIGLAIAFDPTNGQPVVSYLGGPDGFVMGMSIFWFQSDAVIARRGANGTWTETTIATDGNQVMCGNRVSDIGFLVGLWPALTFDSTGKLYVGYRDGHNGQFPLQDWAGTDVEVWEGAPPGTGVCVAEGGNNKNAYGGHLRMVLGANNQPAIIHDQMFGDSDVNGQNVVFQQRTPAGTWTQPGGSLLVISNTQSGASLAYDATEGYGIAVLDRQTNQLGYIHSATGASWSGVDPVFGSGAGGWYPSLAMDPVFHEPAIAFYICSARSSVTETGCNINEDELKVIQRVAGTWREDLVDSEGGYLPQLGFFPDNMRSRRVVVYRTPPAIDPATGLTRTDVGQLKIAVER
ncbi:MAG: hypothetical protein U0228_02525 [Myxococcaceae bacterium]